MGGRPARLGACVMAALVVAGCLAAPEPDGLPEATVVVEDPVDDARGGPGTRGEDPPPPTGADLAQVELDVADDRVTVAFESTGPVAGRSDDALLREELQRGWWWVRFWQGPEDEDWRYLLSVSLSAAGGARTLVVLLCDMREQPYCSRGGSLVDVSEIELEVDGARLAVAFPARALEDLEAPFQWAALTTLNRTSSSANDWWDFAPDWPRGDAFQVPNAVTTEGNDGGIRVGEAADAERRERLGPPHPEPAARAWFPEAP